MCERLELITSLFRDTFEEFPILSSRSPLFEFELSIEHKTFYVYHIRLFTNLLKIIYTIFIFKAFKCYRLFKKKNLQTLDYKIVKPIKINSNYFLVAEVSVHRRLSAIYRI